jgi:hypothetical protein
LVAKGALGDGVVGTLAQLSAVGSTLLMLHFLRCFHASTAQQPTEQPSLTPVATWLAVAFAALVLPWLLFSAVDGASWGHALTSKELWSASWPILAGALLAAALWPWHARLPRIPEGDVLAVAARYTPAARSLSAACERVDGVLRQWPIASMCVALLVLLMSLTLGVP